MIPLLWAFFAVALGSVLVWSFTHLGNVRPRWTAALLVLGTGTAGGIGVTSCIYFVCRLLAPDLLRLGIPIELALFGAAVWNVIRKRGRSDVAADTSVRVPALLIVVGALIFVIGVDTAAIAASWDSNPQGDWDAWSIWNLRARFLAAPDGLIQRAWSPLLTSTHPEYPLLTSAFVARCWAYGGGATPDVVPMATAFLFFLALCAIGISGVARIRSGSLGLIYGLILASTPVLIHESTAQYADVPLACYFLGAALLAAADQPVLAGLFAGFAAWTKDEGLLFLLIFVIAMAVFRRSDLWRTAIGLAAPLALALFFKVVLAHGTASLLAHSMAGLGAKLVDFHRYIFVLGSLAGALAAMGAAFYHPIYPAAIAAFLLRFDRGRRRDMLFFAVLAGAMLLGYIVVYVITPNELGWQVGTTVNRLIVQIWPLLLLILFAGLRTPESILAVTMPASTPEAVRGAARKMRKKQK